MIAALKPILTIMDSDAWTFTGAALFAIAGAGWHFVAVMHG